MVDEASWAEGAERVNRAAELLANAADDAKWVQVVPTVHVELRRDLTIKRFGLRGRHHQSWASPDNFTPADDVAAFRERLTTQLADAIRQAVFRGLNVAIVPHLDAAGRVQEWRNHFQFDPIAVHSGVSYTTLLDAIVDAIEQAGATDLQVDLALSGEMGQSWFAYPAEYTALVERCRERFAKNPAVGTVRLGVALNWNGVAGNLSSESIDIDAVNRLFDAIDFVGFSCYAPLGVPPTAEDFRAGVLGFRRDLQKHGVRWGERPLITSEVGIGGGDPGDTLPDIAAKPYAGRGAGTRPWRDASFAQLRTDFHIALCEYLTAGGELSSVERAFLWSEGPWDPQGVGPNSQPDEAIAQRIARHNAEEQSADRE